MNNLESFVGHVSGRSLTKPGGVIHNGTAINLVQLDEEFIQCRIIFKVFVISLVLPEPVDLLRYPQTIGNHRTD